MYIYIYIWCAMFIETDYRLTGSIPLWAVKKKGVGRKCQNNPLSTYFMGLESLDVGHRALNVYGSLERHKQAIEKRQDIGITRALFRQIFFCLNGLSLWPLWGGSLLRKIDLVTQTQSHSLMKRKIRKHKEECLIILSKQNCKV